MSCYSLSRDHPNSSFHLCFVDRRIDNEPIFVHHFDGERRDNLLKFWQAMIACGVTPPPSVSIGVSTGPTIELDMLGCPLPDIQSWLHSKRLHKYNNCFQGISWGKMLNSTDSDLKALGVHTVGARGRLVKFLMS